MRVSRFDMDDGGTAGLCGDGGARTGKRSSERNRGCQKKRESKWASLRPSWANSVNHADYGLEYLMIRHLSLVMASENERQRKAGRML